MSRAELDTKIKRSNRADDEICCCVNGSYPILLRRCFRDLISPKTNEEKRREKRKCILIKIIWKLGECIDKIDDDRFEGSNLTKSKLASVIYSHKNDAGNRVGTTLAHSTLLHRRHVGFTAYLRTGTPPIGWRTGWHMETRDRFHISPSQCVPLFITARVA